MALLSITAMSEGVTLTAAEAERFFLLGGDLIEIALNPKPEALNPKP